MWAVIILVFQKQPPTPRPGSQKSPVSLELRYFKISFLSYLLGSVLPITFSVSELMILHPHTYHAELRTSHGNMKIGTKKCNAAFDCISFYVLPHPLCANRV